MQAAWSRAIATDKNSDVIIPVIGSHSSSSSSNHNVSYESGYEYVIDAEFFLGDLCELYGVKQQQQHSSESSARGFGNAEHGKQKTRDEIQTGAAAEFATTGCCSCRATEAKRVNTGRGCDDPVTSPNPALPSVGQPA